MNCESESGNKNKNKNNSACKKPDMSRLGTLFMSVFVSFQFFWNELSLFYRVYMFVTRIEME